MKLLEKLSPKAAKRLNFCLIGAGILALAAGIAVFRLTGDSGYTVTTFSMGSYVQQTVYGGNGEEGARAAANAVTELENLISWRVENSDVDRLNSGGKEGLELDSRTWQVLRVCRSVSRNSHGAFDPTIAPVSRLWDFDGTPRVPAADELDAALEKVDYHALSLPLEYEAVLAKGCSLDLGAVGKGAACDAVLESWKQTGVSRGVVAVGGSIGVYGRKPFGRAWTIAVRDPAGEGSLGRLALWDGFVSTSGSYEKCFTDGGKTYHHLLDPSTGYPAESGLVSVTVKSDGGALSDALSTACFVLGMEKSLPLLEKFNAEAIFITTERQIYVTENLREGFTLTSGDYTMEELS